MTDDLYQEIIIEEYRNPQNKGSLHGDDVHSHFETNSSCGDEVTVFLKRDPNTQQIVELKWQGKGCAISQAAMSVLSAKILNEKLTVTNIKNMQKKDMEELLGLKEIVSGREKCLLLGWKAICT